MMRRRTRGNAKTLRTRRPEQTETPMDSGTREPDAFARRRPRRAHPGRARRAARRCRATPRACCSGRSRFSRTNIESGEPKTRSRDVSERRSRRRVFREKTSPTREASVGGFARHARQATPPARTPLEGPTCANTCARVRRRRVRANSQRTFGVLRRAPRAPSDLAIAELEDVRDVNDVVVQFLAYRSFPRGESSRGETRRLDRVRSGPRGAIRARRRAHDGGPRRRRRLSSVPSVSPRARWNVRFTFDFFDFPTVTSRACGLTEATRPGEPRCVRARRARPAVRGRLRRGGVRRGRCGAPARMRGLGSSSRWTAASATAPATPSPTPRRASKRGACRSRGTSPRAHPFRWTSGRDVAAASGTCELDVSALARRGRDAADALVEAVVRDHRDHVADVVNAAHSDPEPQPSPIGALLVRLINVGRRGGGFFGGIALEKSRARRFARRRIPEASSRRHAPARRSPRTNDLRYRRYRPPTPPRDGLAEAVTTDDSPAQRRARAEGDRKLARERRLREKRGAASSRRGSDEPTRLFSRTTRVLKAVMSFPGNEPWTRARSSTRVRSPFAPSCWSRWTPRGGARSATGCLPETARDAEFKKTVRPRFGELCLFEHPFRNGSDREGVFEIRCDDPDIVLADLLRGPRGAAGARARGTARTTMKALLARDAFALAGG